VILRWGEVLSVGGEEGRERESERERERWQRGRVEKRIIGGGEERGMGSLEKQTVMIMTIGC
jgi:hypothetical protein